MAGFPGGPGLFLAAAFDQGEPGPSAGDIFPIRFLGGRYDEYENLQVLQLGNIEAEKLGAGTGTLIALALMLPAWALLRRRPWAKRCRA